MNNWRNMFICINSWYKVCVQNPIIPCLINYYKPKQFCASYSINSSWIINASTSKRKNKTKNRPLGDGLFKVICQCPSSAMGGAAGSELCIDSKSVWKSVKLNVTKGQKVLHTHTYPNILTNTTQAIWKVYKVFQFKHVMKGSYVSKSGVILC